MATSLVLDTDIGTDVDDALALTAILGSPEVELAAVTTVYGDVLLRARMAARIARVAGHEIGPVVPGLGAPRSGREVFWAGHEGTLMSDLNREEVSEDLDAIELLAGSATVIEIEAAGALGRLLAAEMRQFWKFMNTESNAPHDPAAVLMLVEPELFTFATGLVEIDPDGASRFSEADDGPHRIVTDLDTNAVARRIVERILAGCGK